MDGDGDGCGDFEGLARRLDYLKSLGVDALWLAPFQPSPLRDDGYDISDYYNVATRLGSSGDFVEFMRQADSRGIRVIVDLVVNHTSDRHPWFRAARESRDAPTRDWYVWAPKRPPNWRSAPSSRACNATPGRATRRRASGTTTASMTTSPT